MVEEKAPRRRLRWIVLAAVVGAGGWYLRARAATGSARPAVPAPLLTPPLPVREPPAVLDLGRPNPSAVPTSRRSAPAVALPPAAVVEPPAAVVEPPAAAAEPEVAGESPVGRTPAQQPVTAPRTPTAPVAPVPQVSSAPEAVAQPTSDGAVGAEQPRRPRPRPGPPGGRPTPTPRGGTPATTPNGGSRSPQDNNGSASAGGALAHDSAPVAPVPPLSGFGPTGVAPAAPHDLFTPVAEAEPSSDTTAPTPPSSTPAPTPPPPVGSAALQAPGADYTIKGSTGSMLFHTRDSPWYDDTEAEVWFRTPQDAIAAGFSDWTDR